MIKKHCKRQGVLSSSPFVKAPSQHIFVVEFLQSGLSVQLWETTGAEILSSSLHNYFLLCATSYQNLSHIIKKC